MKRVETQPVLLSPNLWHPGVGLTPPGVRGLFPAVFKVSMEA